MHQPPHLYYEPKDWSHTCVLLLQKDSTGAYELPGGVVLKGENCQDSAVRRLLAENNIDVCQPENCLHHLFTFPYRYSQIEEGPHQLTETSINGELKRPLEGTWGDCYECVFRGNLEDLGLSNALCISLADVKDMLEQDASKVAPASCHALKLYFQRHGDMRARRRLLKGYSSDDLEHYGVQTESRGKKPILMLDSFQDDVRKTAIEFTMKTDDGMCPQLLHQADIIILGVSRTGKTPLSIFISQTRGLRVANIPLVFELEPPNELIHPNAAAGNAIDPRRVFCLTRDVEEMEKLRISRMQQAFHHVPEKLRQESTYANYSYIRKDLAKARNLCKQFGFTELDVTERALEECASIIVSKMKERFPDMHIQ